ncbi:uncharacterized protein [Miscanthus floridulus]
MLGCVSSKGVHIYSLKKRHRKWTPLEIAHRPTSEGTSLGWHSGGRVLATASSGSGGKPGALSILSYDGNNGFRARTALQCLEGESISSLCWARKGSFLILALHPSSTICFLRVTNDDPENLENLGLVKYSDHFDGRSPIMLASDLGGHLFAYSYDKLVVFQHSGVDQVTWEISNFVLTKVATSPDNEHAKRRGSRFKYDSEYMLIAISHSGKYVATGGRDTLCYHLKKRVGREIEVTLKGCRRHDVNYGDVKCIDFNPMEDKTKMLPLGGDAGYIHIWAVVNRGTMKSRYTEADRVDEYKKYFYSGPFIDADRIDDEVVVEPDKPCIILNLKKLFVLKTRTQVQLKFLKKLLNLLMLLKVLLLLL